MNRRTLLRSLVALTPVAIAGCGEYDSGGGTPPQDDDGGSDGNGNQPTATETETVPLNPDAFEVTYSRKHYESDGDAVAELNIRNTGEQRARAILVIHFTVGDEQQTVSEPIEVPGEEKKSFRIPLHEPVEDVKLTDFIFETPE